MEKEIQESYWRKKGRRKPRPKEKRRCGGAKARNSFLEGGEMPGQKTKKRKKPTLGTKKKTQMEKSGKA